MLQEQFEPLKMAILKADPTALFYDPNSMYCKGETCSYISDGMPLNRDHGHFSEYGSTQLHQHFNLWAIKYAPTLFKAEQSVGIN
jgi:hypothetical protein